MPNYVVSGAATSVINGTYTQHPTYSNLWVKGSYYLSHDSGPQSDYDYQWWLRTDSNFYYYNTSTSSTPPLTGWILGGIATAGAVPTIAAELVDPYCVAGAGTTIANGTYSFNSGSYNMFMSGYWQHITEPNLKMGYGMMGSYEIYNDSTRLYYASSLTGTWTVEYGAASAPTVTAGACGSTPTPTPTPTPSPTTANIIRPKRSSTASAVPSSLQPYELAVNIPDKKIWVADATGAPVLMSELNDLPPSIDGGTF